MNLNLFDDIDGIILHERENTFVSQDTGTGGDTSRFPENTPLAMAYVPFQQWGNVFDSKEALDNGTIFPDLIFPFRTGGGKR